MPGVDETNELLREIRDILATREQQYQQHLEDVKLMYEQQLAMASRVRIRWAIWIGALALVAVMLLLLLPK